MKFRRKTSTVAVSECGQYEIRMARTVDGRVFHNAWHVPTEKHIEASFDRAVVKRACEAHAKKVAA